MYVSINDNKKHTLKIIIATITVSLKLGIISSSPKKALDFPRQELTSASNDLEEFK